ncbi:MAG: hypothetical protein KDC84_09005 [Crocinitomicaceae bacterium]|nr:hypothetical protein [Crocinitomicaceae bacterium]
MKNLIIISLLFLFSCAKEGKNICIEGKVINPVTGQPIEGIRLVLHKKTSDLGSGSSSVIKSEAYSDINGNFVLSHNGSLFNSYIVLIEYPNEGYHLVGWKDATGQTIGGYQLDVKKGELMDVRLELLPYANVKFNFNNVNCVDTTDLLQVYLSDDYDVFLPGAWEHYGCVNYLGFYGALKPMGYYYIHWDVTRNNVMTSFDDTIYLNEGEMKTYTINY